MTASRGATLAFSNQTRVPHPFRARCGKGGRARYHLPHSRMQVHVAHVSGVSRQTRLLCGAELSVALVHSLSKALVVRETRIWQWTIFAPLRQAVHFSSGAQ